jgi:hypothetical protein
MYDDCKADAGKKLSHVGDVGLNIDFPQYLYNDTPILNMQHTKSFREQPYYRSEDVCLIRSLLFIAIEIT